MLEALGITHHEIRRHDDHARIAGHEHPSCANHPIGPTYQSPAAHCLLDPYGKQLMFQPVNAACLRISRLSGIAAMAITSQPEACRNATASANVCGVEGVASL